MLVASADKLGKRPAQALRDMPSEQRFALTVFTGFAVALALLGVLFILTGDPSSNRANRTVRQPPNLMAQEPAARAQAEAGQGSANAPAVASALP